MPLWEITEGGLQERPLTQFKKLGLYERADLQRYLRDRISALGEDLLVIAEEYGEWEDARRRIDLLAIDRAGHLVVIELKRTDDGGHMELQALRYAAMVSAMTFDDVMRAFAAHRRKHRPDATDSAHDELVAFLDTAEGDEPVVSDDVRIILVSADFGREITTAVLWLNGFDRMDIRCVRLIPYEIDGKILLDIQQVIPLPEAADYQVRVRRKQQETTARLGTDGRDWTKYCIVVDGVASPPQRKRNAVRLAVEALVERGADLEEIRTLLPGYLMRTVPGRPSQDELYETLLADGVNEPNRYFLESPLYDERRDTTYVLNRMWRQNTEPTLRSLTDRFPEAKVRFERAD